MVLWIFHISVRTRCAQILPVSHLCSQRAPDIFRQVFTVPFIYQPVDLAWFLIPKNRGIRSVHHSDKAYPQIRKIMMEILLYVFHITGEPWLWLCYHDLEFPQSRIRQHALELRPCIIETALVVICVYLCDLIIMAQGIIGKQEPLILNTCAFISFGQLIFILFR